ncbi:hypothetical protein [Paenibacillus gallinarum]|uniref:Uncharacterized protein n=1 Tax=Paenibacillus gallinarum TaxID=2762232 RepID=A0ABR8T5Q7_9BACL|nr:hypothetical protein [Paenibacillus gallinarum]MBD7971109.1 hypothetical protein [Paenibacillus gallinarum]
MNEIIASIEEFFRFMNANGEGLYRSLLIGFQIVSEIKKSRKEKKEEAEKKKTASVNKIKTQND